MLSWWEPEWSARSVRRVSWVDAYLLWYLLRSCTTHHNVRLGSRWCRLSRWSICRWSRSTWSICWWSVLVVKTVSDWLGPPHYFTFFRVYSRGSTCFFTSVGGNFTSIEVYRSLFAFHRNVPATINKVARFGWKCFAMDGRLNSKSLETEFYVCSIFFISLGHENIHRVHSTFVFLPKEFPGGGIELLNKQPPSAGRNTHMHLYRSSRRK